MPVFEDILAQANAMSGEHRTQDFGAIAQVLQGVAISQLTHPAPIRKTEGVGEEHFAVIRVRLEDQLVDVRILLGVFREPHLHARLQQGAEGLRHHRGQSALPDPVRIHIAATTGIAVDLGRVERHQRVDANQQINPAFQQH